MLKPPGALGHGLPIGVGMAIAGKILKKIISFVVVGDGDKRRVIEVSSVLLSISKQFKGYIGL